MVSALTVGTNTYVSSADADTYLMDSLRGAPWVSLDPDTKAQALITATRLLEKQCWSGAKTDPLQALSFPRTNLLDGYGNVLDSSVVPEAVVEAEIELAFELSQDTSLETSGGTGSNTQTLKAGSASISYFRPTAGANGAGSPRFPPIVMELIRAFMCGFGGVPGSFVDGTDVPSAFDVADPNAVRGAFSTDDSFDFTQGIP